MSCVGSLILAGFVEDNKFGAVANEVIAETRLELLQTNVVTFSSKLLKSLAGEASLLESTERLIMMMMMMCSNASHPIHTSSRPQTYLE
jgi:hypothetical protein